MTGAGPPTPALSVIVIGYRNEATIVRAVASLIEQAGGGAVELIVVTSGGDRSAERVRRAFPRVIVVEHLERLLPGAARNVGLRAARGEAIAFLAADCVAEAGWVAARLALHRERRRAVASAITNGGPRTPAGWAAHYLTFSGRLPGRASGPVIPPDPAAHGLSFPRDELLALGGFSALVRVGEDTDAARRAHERGLEIFFDPSVRTAHVGPSGTLRMLADQFRRGARRSRAAGPIWPEASLPRLVWRSLLVAGRLLRQTWLQAWQGAPRERWRLLLLAPWLLGGVAAHIAGWFDAQRRASSASTTGRSSPGRRVGLAAAIAALGVAGTGAILSTSRAGIGISPDSVVYVEAGRAIAAGRGLVVRDTTLPLTFFAPLYPAVLGVAGGLGLDAAEAARWLSAAGFGVAVVAIAALAFRATRSAWAALVVAALTLTAPAQLELYSWAWTEPLYVALVLAFLLVLDAGLERGGGGRLAPAAALAALAALTRYAGVAALATGGVAIVALGRGPIRARIRASAAFLLASGAPLALWLVRNALITGHPAARVITFHPPGLGLVDTFGGTMAAWFMPVSVPAPLRVLTLLGALAGVAVVLVGSSCPDGGRVDRARRMVVLLGLFTAASLVVLWAAIMLLHPDLQREPGRMLAPLWGPITAILVTGAHHAATTVCRRGSRHQRRLLAATAAALAFVAVLSVSRTVAWIAVYRHEGHGFTARRWTASDLMNAVRSEPPSRVIFSNVSSAIYWIARRSAGPIPAALDRGTGRAHGVLEPPLATLGETLARRDARVAYFNVGTSRGLCAEELASRLDLVVLRRAGDGCLLGPRAGRGP